MVEPAFILYTPYEGFNLGNQNSRKFGVFGRMLEGSHSPFVIVILRSIEQNATKMFNQLMSSSLIYMNR